MGRESATQTPIRYANLNMTTSNIVVSRVRMKLYSGNTHLFRCHKELTSPHLLFSTHGEIKFL